MATPKVRKLRFSPGRAHKLTDRQRAFVAEYVVDMNATRAAVAAGYSPKTAASLGCQLLDDKVYPLVAVEVRRALARKELVAERKADDVLRYIHCVMWFQPLQFFLPGDDGGWLLDEDKLATLPPAIGCLIEEVEVRRFVVGTGADRQEVTRYWVRLVSKTAAMALAAKHQLGDKSPPPVMQQNTVIDITELTRCYKEHALSEARQMVEDAKQQPVIGLKELPADEQTPPLNRLECRPSRNGSGHG
jgi:phage terminase small subunit